MENSDGVIEGSLMKGLFAMEWTEEGETNKRCEVTWNWQERRTVTTLIITEQVKGKLQEMAT